MSVTPAIVVVLVGAGVASAEEAPKFAKLCKDGSKDHAAAGTRLAALDGVITKAANDAPAAPLVQALEALLETPCFLVASSDDEPSFAKVSTFALKRWWRDGGKEWLEAQLSGARDVTFPPSVRKTLVLDTSPNHPLARMLCRTTDATCGAETAGWLGRAEEVFRERAESEARWPGSGYTVNLYQRPVAPKLDDEAGRRDQTLDIPLWRCAHPAGKKKLDFATWRDCVGALRQRVAQFPAGAFKAPSSGWLVIRGRRGHYNFCDQLSAYDLATGAYYTSKSCSGLALQHDGSVDGQRTDAARTPAIEAGRVSVDNLREAAWMIFLADHVEEGGFDGLDSFPMPPGLEAKVEVGGYGSIGVGSFSTSSAQTRLAWTWLDGGKVLAEGHVTWPYSHEHGEDHAVDLLRVVEAGVIQGCPPAPLPTPALAGCGKGGVSSVDSSASSLCKVQAELSARLAGFKCPAPKP